MVSYGDSIKVCQKVLFGTLLLFYLFGFAFSIKRSIVVFVLKFVLSPVREHASRIVHISPAHNHPVDIPPWLVGLHLAIGEGNHTLVEYGCGD